MNQIKTVIAIVFALVVVGCASTKPLVKPNYDFAEFTKVDKFIPSLSFSMVAMNDQVIKLSDSVKTKYILVLQYPDSNFDFPGGIGIIRQGGHIRAGKTRVYALNNQIKVGIPIKAIYKVEGKEELEAIKLRIDEAKAEAVKANQAE